MFRNMKFRYKILLGYVLCFLIILVVGLVMIRFIGVTAKQYKVLEEKSNLAGLMNEAGKKLWEIGVKMQLAGDLEQGEYDNFINEAVGEFKVYISSVGKMEMTEAEEQLLEKFQSSAEEYIQAAKEISRFGKIDEKNRARYEAVNTQFRNALNRSEKYLISLEKNFEKDETSFSTRFYDNVNSFKWKFIVGLVFLLIAFIPISFVLARSVTNQIKVVLNDVTSSLVQISASVEEQERVATEQAGAVNETTATMDEFETSFSQSATRARESMKKSEDATEALHQGMETLEKSVASMLEIQEKMQKIADKILNLSEQNTQIEMVTNMVSQIAEQTNMLALNAAVEATRAGEYGKGFSVVAQEIRKLSAESKKSAEKIRSIVNEIQKATNSTVMVTEDGTRTVEESANLATETRSVFESLIQSTEFALDVARQMTLEIEQQSNAVKQVLTAMEDISRGSRSAAEGVNQIKISIRQLKESSHDLQNII